MEILVSAFALVVARTFLAFLFGFASSSSDELFAARPTEIVALAFALAFAGTFVFLFGFALPGSPPDEGTSSSIAPLTASQASTRAFPSNGGYDPESIKFSVMPAPIVFAHRFSVQTSFWVCSNSAAIHGCVIFEQTDGVRKLHNHV